MADFQKITFQFLLFAILYSLFAAFTGCAVPRKKPPEVAKPIPAVIIPPPAPPAPPPPPSKPTEEIKIKIGLLENVSHLTIGSENKLVITDIKTDDRFEMPGGSIKIVNGKLVFGKKQFLHSIKISTLKNKDKISVNGKKYKGDIIIKIINKKKIRVINELGLEEYLCGVLPKEVAPDWHEEALKAQAVVARTFALKNFNRHISSGFNLCNQTHCQVYTSSDAEDERSNKAVYETQGEVLVYDDKLISSFYHSSCGGRTEDIKNVWNTPSLENPEYLSSVKCGFCTKDKWYNWSAACSLKKITVCLKNSGYKIGTVKKIKTIGHTSSNRVKEILVEHSKGKLWLLSNRFRTAIGANIIRSTNFIVKTKNNIVYFNGHGWGHGVGMCQWGAKGMAEDGWDYKDILQHFYKGVKIKKFENLK
ncbi:MAG: SpoIID/LytB domain-containing protein [Elusimicrobiota bacterium]